LAAAERRPVRAASAAPAARASGVPADTPPAGWAEGLSQGWRGMLAHLWGEARSLVRVTRIADPEAALLAPEQSFFLRENLKLRLLNARLALLSRQFDIAQADLRDAQVLIDRYFDRSSKRVVAASELLRQVTVQARQVTVPRPDATLAAVAAAAAGR